MTHAGEPTMPTLAVHRSRKLIPDFALLRPRSAEAAVALQAEAGGGAAFMAGGIDLVNRMKFGAPITTVIHLGGIAGLTEITQQGDALVIGACVTHHQLQTSSLIQAQLPALAQVWWTVGNIRVRVKGTVGGNVMAREPAYDFTPAIMAAGAVLEFLDLDGRTRRVPAAALTDEHGAPVPQAGLLTRIILPPAARLRLQFDRSLRPAVTLSVGLDLDGARITGGRVGIGCAFAAPLACALPIGGSLAASDLAGLADDLARRVAGDLPEPVADGHAGAAYRRRMVGVLLRRNLTTLAEALS